MASAAERNYQRRLKRFLEDVDYGPKLARMRGEDEQRILQLIYDNRGKQARAEADVIDEQRRVKARAAARRRLEKLAVDNQMTRHIEGGTNPYRPGLEEGARLMSDTDLRFASKATREQLIARARQPPRFLTPRGEDWNPFWYH